MPKTRLVTAEELFRDGPEHAELIRGGVVELMPNGADHGRIVYRIGQLLGASHPAVPGLWIGSGDVGFLLERDPDTVRAPDVAVVRRSRLEGIDTSRFLPFAPDLAIEVVSPNDSPAEVREKASMWLAHGSAEVWVVDPGSERVTVHRPGAEPVELSGDDPLSGGELFPDFSVLVRQIFDEE